jgi:hypothetical protein
MAVGRIETLIVLAPIAVVTLVVYAVSSSYSENVARNVSARESGFDNYADQSRAKASGYVNASDWRAKVTATAAAENAAAERAAAEEAQRRKGWEAKAPELAAQAAKEAADAELRQANMKRTEAEGAALLRERTRDPIERMKMSAFSWKSGGFGVVGILNVTIENNNDFPVKDVSIECTFSGKSGTELSTASHRIYDSIPAKAKKTFRDINFGLINSQSARARLKIGLSPL